MTPSRSLEARSPRRGRGPHRPSRPASERGFSLVEMLVAIAIVGVLAAVAIPQLLGARELGRRSAEEKNFIEFKNVMGGNLQNLYQDGMARGECDSTTAADLVTCFVNKQSHVHNPYNRGQAAFVDSDSPVDGQVGLVGEMDSNCIGEAYPRVIVYQNRMHDADRSYRIEAGGEPPCYMCPSSHPDFCS